jgi:hypothetical protein
MCCGDGYGIPANSDVSDGDGVALGTNSLMDSTNRRAGIETKTNNIDEPAVGI